MNTFNLILLYSIYFDLNWEEKNKLTTKLKMPQQQKMFNKSNHKSSKKYNLNVKLLIIY